jgi:catechol 2,3-dioxygenase-like lactoylglutathione lyase family enzyme
MILGIDHILLAVASVEAATQTYQRLGFQVLPGGAHPLTGTYNALVPLSDGVYIELIGVKDRALVQQKWAGIFDTLARDNRLVTFALDVDDLASEAQNIRARGLQIGDPAPGERTRPDGQRVAWLKSDFVDADLPFLIQDVTPRALRIPPPTEGLGQAATFATAVVRAEDLRRALDDWRALLGTGIEVGYTFGVGRGAVRLEQSGGQRAGLAAIELAVDDLAQRVSELAARGIQCTRLESRAIIAPTDAAGANLLLAQQG